MSTFCSSRWVAKQCLERVQADALVDAGRRLGAVEGASQLTRGQRIDRVLAWKQPAPPQHHAALARCQPPGAQQAQEMLAQHGVTVLATFALFDPDHHAFAVDVDVTHLERDHLGGAQAGAVSHAERRPVLEAPWA